MSALKGFSKQQKRTGDINQYVTVQPIGNDRHGLDITGKIALQDMGNETTTSLAAAKDQLAITATAIQPGDIVVVDSSGEKSVVRSLINANTVQLEGELSTSTPASEQINIFRPSELPLGTNGKLDVNAVVAQGPTQFVLNGGSQEVTEDTVTPANNRPLPVKIVDATGDVDVATQTTLAALLTELQLKADLTETQPVSAASLPLPTGAATETTLDALLTELELKADLTETQPVSAASLPLPTGAATETTLDALLTELELKADLTETQPVSAASLPLPTGAATETTVASIDTEVTALNTLLADKDIVHTGAFEAASSNIDDTTGVEIASVAQMTREAQVIEIFNATGEPLRLDVGGTIKYTIAPGGTDSPVQIICPAATSVKVKALSGAATITLGLVTYNLIGR